MRYRRGMGNAEYLARVHLAVENYADARRSRDAAIVAAVRAGCTQAEVSAATAGALSPSAIRKILAADRPPSAERVAMVQKIARQIAERPDGDLPDLPTIKGLTARLHELTEEMENGQ